MQHETMSTTLAMPPSPDNGIRIPTLNNFGWMLTINVEHSDQFIEHASKSPDWSLDIGCAYGIHTLAAIRGGGRVVAVDLDARHLEILRSQLEPALSDRLQVSCGAFPDVELPVRQFGTILCSRVLHFMDPETLQRAVARIANLLLPGGKVFVAVVTPYHRLIETFIPEYEQRKKAGDPWPGFVTDVRVHHTEQLQREQIGSKPMHFMEPPTLRAVFENAGLVVEHCEFHAIKMEHMYIDGREGLQLVASKPLE